MIIVKRLREIQNRFGFLPDKELEQLARLVGVPLYRIEEVASFFPAFRQERDKPAVLEVRVCRDMACHHAGAAGLLDPKGGLASLCADSQIQSQLRENAPRWAAEAVAQAAKAGKRVELPTPDGGQCRLVVEGVSCLGRCDRAPAVWIERHPMPAGEHAWVCARAPGETAEQFQKRVGTVIRSVASDAALDHRASCDPDADYAPHTNRTADAPANPRGDYLSPRPSQFPKADPDHPPPQTPAWQIDLYAANGWPRDYRVARQVAEFLKERRGLAPWPTGEAFAKLPAATTPEEQASIDEEVRRAVEREARKAAGQGRELDAERRAEVEKEARRRAEDKAHRDRFIRENNRHLPAIDQAKLQGMGGAGMAAYQKWLDVWMATPQDKTRPPAKYVVANGDESEPGTFKDRELLGRTPHLVVEGVILAGLMTGATAGYVFIRHEYHEQVYAIKAEIERAERLGACGSNVFQSGISFPVTWFESPGGYICGEQSALIEAMEDHRAQPRNRPPDLQANGLWDMPTVVNNVETLAWAPSIVQGGGPAYFNCGWKAPRETLPATLKKVEFSGKRLFSISGDVIRPGVYEVPIGIPLRELLLSPTYCGGISGGRGVKAVATSGPSGGLLPATIPMDGAALAADLDDFLKEVRKRPGPDGDRMEWLLRQYVLPKNALDLLDVPLDLNVFRNLNRLVPYKLGGGAGRDYPEVMLGAGIVVYADGTDTFDAAVNFSQFFRNESCGKCVPCRIGSQKLTQLGTELLARRNGHERTQDAGFPVAVQELAANVPEIAKAMKMTSICALGAVAPSPIWSALEYFPEEVLARPTPNPSPQPGR